MTSNNRCLVRNFCDPFPVLARSAASGGGLQPSCSASAIMMPSGRTKVAEPIHILIQRHLANEFGEYDQSLRGSKYKKRTAIAVRKTRPAFFNP